MVIAYAFIPFAPGPIAAPLALTYLVLGFDFVSVLIVLPLVLRVAFFFPEDAIPVNARAPKWPWFFAMAGPIWGAWMVGMEPWRAYVSLDVAFLIAFLGLVTYRFIHAGPVSRRRVKWSSLATISP
jgi:hypothetical protein